MHVMCVCVCVCVCAHVCVHMHVRKPHIIYDYVNIIKLFDE